MLRLVRVAGCSAPRTRADLQDGAVLGFGFVQPSQVVEDLGEVVAAGQGVRVLGAQDPGADLQDGAVLGFGFV